MKHYKKYSQQGYERYQKIKELESIKELRKINPVKAMSELIHMLKKYPTDMYATFLYGQYLEEEGNYDEAEIAYRKVADSTSWNRCAGLVGLAGIYRRKGDTALAKKYYWQSIKEGKTEQKVSIFALAKIESLDENYEEAFRILDLLQNETSESEIERVKIYGRSGNFAKVLELAKTITPANTNEKIALYLEMALAAVGLNDIPAAKYYFLEAKENAPHNLNYHKTLLEEAKMYFELGEYQAAIDNCEELYREGETLFGNVNYILGRAKQEQGKYKSAIESYKIAKGEATVGTTYALVEYYLGTLELAMGDFKNAEIDLKECLENSKKIKNLYTMSLVVSLFSAYISQGKYEEAKALIADTRENKHDSDSIGQLDLADLIIAKKTNSPLPYNPRTYREFQIASYSKEEALMHIKEHHQGSASETCHFSKDININELYDEIVCQIIPENRGANDLLEKYYIDYPNAGYTPDGKIINRIGVIVVPGTTDIITMYPDNNENSVCQGDILKEMAEQKGKANNRISKFNARFAKKSQA